MHPTIFFAKSMFGQLLEDREVSSVSFTPADKAITSNKNDC